MLFGKGISPEMKNKYVRLINNSGVFLLGNLGSQFFGMVFLFVSTFVISPAEFGIIEIVRLAAALLFPIISAAVAEGVFRFAMDADEDAVSVFTNGLVIIAIGTAALFLLIPGLRLIQSFDTLMPFLLALVIVQMIQATAKQFTRAIGKVTTFVFSDFVNAVSMLVFGAAFVIYFRWGVQGYLLTYVVAPILDCIFLFVAAKLYTYIDRRAVSLRQIKRILKYSLPLAPNSIMWWLTETSNRYFILYFLGAAMTGIYAVASRIPGLITVFTAVFFKAWQMSAVEEYLSENKSQFYSRVFNFFWVGLVLSASIIFIILPTLMRVIVADDYFQALQYIPLLIIVAVFSAFQAFIGTNYTASKDSLGALTTSSGAAVISVLLNYLLIPLLGLYGAAIATLFSYIFVFTLRFHGTKKHVKIDIDWRRFILSLMILGIQALLLILISPLVFSMGGLICLGFLLKLNGNTVTSVKDIIKAYVKKKGLASHYE